jgi:2-desacetyl-2-hydroxyethyl bacteriochlorophyllide A dehydrogenase
MKAAFIHDVRDVRVESVGRPAIDSDEILVKVMACGICGTDIHTYNLGRDARGKRPVLVGHEWSGEVVEVGDHTRNMVVGERVVGVGFRNCGQCWWCQHEQPMKCRNVLVPGEGLDGAFAEYVVVPNPRRGSTFFRIPDGLSWEEAATIEPVAIACYGVMRACIQPGETVVVLGAGMIGQCIAQVCKATVECKVIVSEPCAFRRNLAGHLGADETINPKTSDLVDFIRQTTGGEMASVVFDCAGSTNLLNQAVSSLRWCGRLMQVATYERNLEIAADLTYRMFQVGNVIWHGCGGQRWDTAMELIEKNQVKTSNLITHVFPLDRVAEAFETQVNGQDTVKVMIKP